MLAWPQLYPFLEFQLNFHDNIKITSSKLSSTFVNCFRSFTSSYISEAKKKTLSSFSCYASSTYHQLKSLESSVSTCFVVFVIPEGATTVAFSNTHNLIGFFVQGSTVAVTILDVACPGLAWLLLATKR